MGVLSDDLKNMGYEPTDRESPFDEDGKLWTKGYELVCDETGIVIDKGSGNPFRRDREGNSKVHRYPNSEKVKLIGGYFSSYEWGETEDGFVYDLQR